MKRFIVALSPQTETAIVLVAAFGTALVYSLLMAVGVLDVPIISDARLLRTLGFELLVGGALVAMLWMRGWTFEHVGLRMPVFQDVIDGVGLLVVAYLIPAVLLSVLPPEFKQSATNALGFAPLSLPLVAAMSLVNPVFEELFVVGYVFATFGSANRIAAINVSIALRLAYHLYQGPAAIIFILPLAIVFAWWYSTRPSLWSLLLAHMALDFIGLAPHAA